MCKNCTTLPKNLWLRGPDELFQLLEPLSTEIDDGHFIVVRKTFSLDDLVSGKMDDPFSKGMSIIIRCSECGEYFTCAYKTNKGAGFWNRNSVPF